MTNTPPAAGTDPGSTEHHILDLYRTQNAAMTSGDTTRLDALLHDRYVAVHIGGYRQSKREWLQQIRAGAGWRTTRSATIALG